MKTTMDEFQTLITESRNKATENIDRVSTIDLLQMMHDADGAVMEAIAQEIHNIACALDAIVERLQSGGRLFYLGAGTSGRLGVLDASECPPTFNTSPEMVQGIIAGGDVALRHSVEGVEDDAEAAVEDLQGHNFTKFDVLVGVAASGRTPYVLGGISYAHLLGAMTIGLSCVPDSKLAQVAHYAITPAVGPEVITGSTRMKAGTATKLVLNMLSTGTMIRLGFVYGNLMVNLHPTNEKLHQRARRIVMEATGRTRENAAALLQQAGSIKTAIVMHKLHLDRETAEQRVAQAQGRLRKALGEE
ncbi:MAG TPA: N-acetylmuramic acid 6-phosphate etherase [Acidobacteriaceae bacterium]|jgi:N-acetylmuramic acid 6-phosphate etherase|nr:N-acetylmuramic acid 6-phosphate etherase [Acidobacteriaceae bacterium]